MGTKKVEKVEVKDLKRQTEKDFSCEGVFIYIGYEPETDFINCGIQMDESGFIITSEELKASEDGIFACGDCRKKSLYQVVTACAEGAIAVDSAYKYITAKG